MILNLGDGGKKKAEIEYAVFINNINFIFKNFYSYFAS